MFKVIALSLVPSFSLYQYSLCHVIDSLVRYSNGGHVYQTLLPVVERTD